jgi:hypothetical protein
VPSRIHPSSLLEIIMAVTSVISLSGTTEATSQQPGPVGQIREEQDVTYGFRRLRLVKNSTASTIVAGSTVSFASGSSINVGLAAAATLKQFIAGITVVDIPAGYYGWAVCSGDVPAVSDGAFLVNVRLRVVNASGTAGRLDSDAAAAAEDEFFAVGLAAATGAAQSVRVRVSGLL